ncbi:MAG: pyruvate kinase [Candidatus Pacebacteria bacterium]|nr:pyruvate kinase [Candidatus Paceibacterota bacterium]
MKNSKAQIVATLGPISSNEKTLKSMIEHNLDVVRLNFSWADIKTHTEQIALVRKLERELDRRIPIIIDLPGPRVQEKEGHTYNHHAISSITKRDEEFIKFAAEQGVEYVAVSFVGKAEDIVECRQIIQRNNGSQKIIAKIERKIALESLDEIILAADAVMVARGDLGNEVPLEQIPFVQEKIISKAKAAGKPVIVATQMMLSMVNSPTPTRAEVTDVENAIAEGADAVMLSEETAQGKYPIEAVTMMEKIVLEAEKHMAGREKINEL